MQTLRCLDANAHAVEQSDGKQRIAAVLAGTTLPRSPVLLLVPVTLSANNATATCLVALLRLEMVAL